MLSLTPIFLLALAGLPVEATSLSGGTVSGQLVELSATELKLQPENGAVTTIPTADLLELRGTSAATPAAGETPLVRVRLVDGSVLQLAELKNTLKELQGKHPYLEGVLSVPMTAVHSLRFTPPNAKFDPLWEQLLEKGTKSDMIVLQKAEVLDHLDGVVGAIDEQTIKFLLDGDEIPVKREKAFGIIYARKPYNGKLTARVQFANGDSIAAKSVTSNGDEWKVTSLVGQTWTLAASDISLVDYSLGKVVYLSTMEPRNVKYTPFIQFDGQTEFYWKFRRDRSLEGKPLRLGQKTYSRGLAIHSKTELRYRLGGEYRRFQALLGIDDEITNTNWGATAVRIVGDRRELYAGECRPRQSPIPLDLDVSDVVELDIIVDFGPDKSDISDRIHLADARLVK